MKTFKTEREFEREVRRRLRTLQYVVLLPKIESGQEPGWPDIIGSVQNKAFAIELKMPGKKLSKAQEKKIAILESFGWEVLILYPKDFSLAHIEKSFNI